jgi:hypothetical protein
VYATQDLHRNKHLVYQSRQDHTHNNFQITPALRAQFGQLAPGTDDSWIWKTIDRNSMQGWDGIGEQEETVSDDDDGEHVDWSDLREQGGATDILAGFTFDDSGIDSDSPFAPSARPRLLPSPSPRSVESPQPTAPSSSALEMHANPQPARKNKKSRCTSRGAVQAFAGPDPSSRPDKADHHQQQIDLRGPIRPSCSSRQVSIHEKWNSMATIVPVVIRETLELVDSCAFVCDVTNTSPPYCDVLRRPIYPNPCTRPAQLHQPQALQPGVLVDLVTINN